MTTTQVFADYWLVYTSGYSGIRPETQTVFIQMLRTLLSSQVVNGETT